MAQQISRVVMMLTLKLVIKMLGDKNEIKAGDSSTNIQGQNVDINYHHGLSYAEVRQAAMDIFRSNFYDLGETVETLIEQRAEEIINKYLDRLQQEAPNSINNTKEPDVRYAIYNAQKNHSRRGDKEIAELMVEALVERTKLGNQDLLKLIINESLEVIPKLTMKQIDILTLLFLFRNVNIGNVFSLSDLSKVIKIFSRDLTTNEWVYQHLQFTGSISIGTLSYPLLDILAGHYKNQYELSEERDIRKRLSQSDSSLLELIDVWENSNLKNSTLTSVGIAIALSNFNIKTHFNFELNQWINEQ